jgi:hypothetical protein
MGCVHTLPEIRVVGLNASGAPGATSQLPRER